MRRTLDFCTGPFRKPLWQHLFMQLFGWKRDVDVVVMSDRVGKMAGSRVRGRAQFVVLRI